MYQYFAGISVNDFHTIEIKCENLSEKYGSQLVEQLRKNIDEHSSVLYYFVCKSNPDKILSVVEKRKSDKRKKSLVKLPKINREFSGKSKILYVGKTNENFISRLEYHLGLKSKSTYALHLSEWAPALRLELELHYSVVNLPKNKTSFIEELESVLHFHFKPLLGRTGH